MEIHGLNKTTLLDYPGRVASTIFTGACNFRCPFCQNGDLVLNPASQPLISEEEVFAHLDKRKGVVTGVCISGGEPTLQKDLAEFIKKLKERELKVKLDTNGYRPEIVKKLIADGLVDYIAMDIKSSIEKYSEATGVDFGEKSENKIKKSIDILSNSDTDYEFRTTIVRNYHDEDTIKSIGELIRGAKKYYLQSFTDSDFVPDHSLEAWDKETLLKYKDIMGKYVETAELRGVD